MRWKVYEENQPRILFNINIPTLTIKENKIGQKILILETRNTDHTTTTRLTSHVYCLNQ